ncbi:hypothetical protein EFM54_08450 [Lentilactobacillus buchneri]|uniref:matrixin family metalloprotease n=1 Tax=Lentilactobacillus buchneri TaxID=1581 RepID=UPI0021A75DFD|nr:matrixin family metalloprotease [Lentilactobacillus buchneri]MCT2899006.1 hypothetical protein [Lentilactobacillus buchneri]
MKKILMVLTVLISMFAFQTTLSAKKAQTYKVKAEYVDIHQKQISLAKSLTYKTEAKRIIKAKTIPGYTPIQKQITFKPRHKLKVKFMYQVKQQKEQLSVGTTNQGRSFSLQLKSTDTPTEGCQWNTRTITYEIDQSIPQRFQDKYLQAIKNWNDIGIVKLVPTTKNPDINMTEGSYSSNIITTLAYAATLPYHNSVFLNDGLNQITHADIIMFGDELSDQPLSDTSAYHTEVAMHEIGHALGLAHNLTGFESSVMNTPIWFETNGEYCGITNNDTDTIEQMYGWLK